jgi:hypothetical protein
MRNELVSLGVVVSPDCHDAVVGISGEERLPVSAVTMRIAAHAIARMVRGLVPEDVLLGDANDVWVSFDRIERLAASAKTLLAARVDEAGDWKRAGARSAADHLAKLGGTTAYAARRALETSKQAAELPVVAEALRGGQLSNVQAAAVADAAAADPSAGSRLVRTALSTNVRELRDECLRTKAAADPDPDATYRRIHTERRAQFYTDLEGGRNLYARGNADQMSRIEKALEPLVDDLFKKAWGEGRHEPREVYVFDALVMRAEQDPAAEPEPGTKKRAPKPRFLGLLHAPFEALVRGALEGEETCEIVGVGPIPIRTARELLGESILKLVITKGVDVANVVHLGRGPTAAQRIALLWTSPKCSNIECSRMMVEVDHNNPWADKQETVLGNLDPFCGHDHDLKTNHGWSLVEGTGRRAFVPPDDPRHPRNKPPP